MSQEEVRYWRRLFFWLVIGSIPAAIIGAALSGFFEDLFSSTAAVGIFLVVTSCLLWGADFATARAARAQAPGRVPRDRWAPLDALIVGCYQALAIAPGLSRSGSTIAAGIFLGFDRETAARFAFLLSIPAILGAFLFKLNDLGGSFGRTGRPGPAGGLSGRGDLRLPGGALHDALPQGAPPAAVRHLHAGAGPLRDRAESGVGGGRQGALPEASLRRRRRPRAG